MNKNNTNIYGKSFNDLTKILVWSKRLKHPWGDNWGYDKFGNIIKFDEYGKVNQKYSWDIDHSNPKANNGTDSLQNLQPLQSYYNRYIKSDNYPWGTTQHLKKFKGLPNTLKI